MKVVLVSGSELVTPHLGRECIRNNKDGIFWEVILDVKPVVQKYAGRYSLVSDLFGIKKR
jgi:hypothetical protein